jgi:thioesterase domain-containing protein
MSAIDKTEWGTYLKLKMKMVANLWAINRYTPRPYAGRIDLFLTHESLQSREHPRFNWRNFTTAQAVLHQIAGTHNTITGTDDTEIDEAVMEDLAKRLMGCINEVLADNGNN